MIAGTAMAAAIGRAMRTLLLGEVRNVKGDARQTSR